jgi:hypothetical protein
MVQVGKCLPRKHKALSSNPITAKDMKISAHNNAYMNVHRSLIYYCQQLETIQISIKYEWMNKFGTSI